ncbi:MAG TPA: TatD family hydrolase [Candidatus Thermoplasmatota archaeon]|nr:TatD family hydrolase [Candidatus Thermoplasmatota archaeon]
MLRYDGPILDNHFHIQEHGLFLQAIRVFHKHGGTHVTHIPIPGRAPKKTKADWREFFEAHLRLSDRIEAETPVRVIRAVGPYPVEFVETAKEWGVEKARDAFREGYAAAFEIIREGKAVALGEVGRAHFPIAAEIQLELTTMLQEAFDIAAEGDTPVILHTEHATPEVFHELSDMANLAHLDHDRVVKHYAPPAILPDENFGLVPSIIASRSNVQAAAAQGNRFLLETDYIDEPTRPNGVLPPSAVPQRTKALLQQGSPIELLEKVHRELPARVFKVTMEPGRPVR